MALDMRRGRQYGNRAAGLGSITWLLEAEAPRSRYRRTMTTG